MGKISSNVIDKIEKENIKPIGKWSFVLKRSFIWALFGINILIGSIGLAISIYLFEISDIFNLILSVNDFVEVLVLAIPVIWVVLTIIFLIAGYLNFKYTERGYRFSFGRILLINILSILVLGILLHSTNTSEKLNNVFAESITTYNNIVDPRYKIWNRPDAGFIAGKILSVDKKEGESDVDNFQMEDLEKNTWNVDVSEANVRARVKLEEGEEIKVSGNVIEEGQFEASDVLPWGNPKGKMQGIHR